MRAAGTLGCSTAPGKKLTEVRTGRQHKCQLLHVTIACLNMHSVPNFENNIAVLTNIDSPTIPKLTCHSLEQVVQDFCKGIDFSMFYKTLPMYNLPVLQPVSLIMVL